MKPIMSFTAMSLGMALFSQGLAAQDTSAEGEVTIVGRVADRCLFTVPSKVIDLGELSLPGTDASAGRIDASKVNGANETLEGWCNGTAATMTVEAFPIKNVSFAASAPSGFDRVINYTATATANAVDGTDSSVTSGAGSAVAVGMFTGPIPVALSGASTPTGGILVSGDYQGLVRVTLAPNVSFGQPE
jgi:type 1 fimbria pilin